jgi:endonuclease/exonuclease/phosphatase family metal-dependent hydrolase
LSGSRKINIDTQLKSGVSFLFPSSLRSLVRKLFRLPGFRLLKPVALKLLQVAEPAGRVTVRNAPIRGASGEDNVITVLSANLWHDWPRYRRLSQRLETFAKLVEEEKINILILQEVARMPNFRSDEWLAERLGMAYVYSRANGHERGIGFEEGLAVFSRFPLSAPRLKHLKPDLEPFARRLALGVDVHTSVGQLLVFSVHLGMLPRHNATQMHHLHNWVTTTAGERPVLIGGDFNAHETSAQITFLKQTSLDLFRCLNPKADGTTHEVSLPWNRRARRRRLDYIFLNPGRSHWKVLDARHLEARGKPHSDHRAVLARIIPSPKPSTS